MRKPSTPACSDGYTLAELMVGFVVGMLVTAAVIALATSARFLYSADEVRVRLNQHLRAGQTFLTNDLRQAGELLPADFPAIEIVNGGAGAPDVLIVRRNLLDTVLPLCEDLSGTDTTFMVGDDVDGSDGCTPLPDSDLDLWPDNLQAWRAARLAGGGTLKAYVFNPTDGTGQMFEYVGEDNALLTLDADPATVWNTTYWRNELCRVYILEERQYELVDSTLRLTVNGDTAGAINVVHEIDDLQLTAVFQDASQQDTLGFGDLWRELATIAVTLEASAPVRDRQVAASTFFESMPRNILSQ